MFGHRHIHEALLGVQVHCWRRLHRAALSPHSLDYHVLCAKIFAKCLQSRNTFPDFRPITLEVCGPGMGWGELGWGGNRRFPTTSTGGGGSWASTRSFPSKLVGGNSRLPYKSFPFRTLLAYCCLLKSGK